ncbi:MAG: vWA domain-containing protein [Isosphaeraceae bacterium]
MNLVHPAALALGALALPIVAFYILKVRLRRVPVSTLLFWEQIFEEKKPRSLWQTLRHWISLLMQLAVLALLVFALADPIFRWQQAQARRLVMVVDNSASMNANDILPTRLESAKAEARRIVDGLRLGDELAIIAAGPEPRVACGLTDHQRTLREAIDTIAPMDAPTRITEAVALARRLLSGTEKTRKAIVLTDAGFGAAGALACQEDVDFFRVGGDETSNVAITRLQARRSLVDPIGYEILVEAASYAKAPISCRLELDLDDDPIDVVPLTLAPGQPVVKMFEKTSAEGGRLRARIDYADALPADNTAWAILPKRARQSVTLVTRGNVFLEKVFEAIPLVDLEVLKVEDGQPIPVPKPKPKTGGAAGAEGAPIVVYHRSIPETIPPGNVVVIEPGKSGPLWDIGEVLHNPVVAKQDRESPLMANIRLDNVLMPEARKLTLKSPAQVLAESGSGDPLYAVLERPGAGTGTGAEGSSKLAVLTVDLDKSDLPLQTVFPILMTNLLNWYGGTKGELRESLPAGSTARVELPTAADPKAPRSLVVRSPDGTERTLAVPAGTSRATVGPLDRCGVWTVRMGTGEADNDRAKSQTGAPVASAAAGVVVAELPCNLADRRESDLRPAEGLPERPGHLAAGLAVRPVWYYLLASAWLLICWEWFLYQRRWID